MNYEATAVPIFWMVSLPIYLVLTNKFSPNAGKDLSNKYYNFQIKKLI